VAVEVGLNPVNDPFGDQQDHFVQLKHLLNSTGRRLIHHYQWENMVREHLFNTVPGQEEYDLPADFAYMLDQTGWIRDQNVPLAGPLSAQDWQYLKGRNLLSSTIYASFRLNLGKLRIFAQGALLEQEIAYEYMSENWVQPAGVTNQDEFKQAVLAGSDTILYPADLCMLYLKGPYLGAQGQATDKADAEFSDAFMAWTGMNKSAAKLNMARNYLGYPYLDAWRNLPDTGYGNKPII
jgi:hypothetical protein